MPIPLRATRLYVATASTPGRLAGVNADKPSVQSLIMSSTCAAAPLAVEETS
jgi:hypothetical protein